jgi:hypothetical protein
LGAMTMVSGISGRPAPTGILLISSAMAANSFQFTQGRAG